MTPSIQSTASIPAVRQRVDYVLPGALAPYADESLPGLVMRNAERLRFHDPRHILRRLGLPVHILVTLCQMDPTSAEGRAMQTALNVSEEAFRSLTLWTDDVSTVSIMGRPIWRDLVRPDVRAVCPLCLVDSTHHRAVWLIDAMPVCARHEVFLVDHCPAPGCGRRLKWMGNGIYRCGSPCCSFDLRKAVPVKAEPEYMGGITAFDRLLHCDDPGSQGSVHMPFGPALRLAMTLGRMSLAVDTRRRPPHFIRHELLRVPQIIDAGWQALDDWPNGFHRLLDQLRTRSSLRSGTHGLQKAFGKLSLRVHEWAREPWGAHIGAAFVNYVVDQPDLVISQYILKKYASGTGLQRKTISVNEAQHMLKICPASMMAIAERRNMFVVPPQGVGVPALLSADSVRALQQEMHDLLLPMQARAILGVGARVMDQLRESGIVQPIPEAERVMESRPFRRSEMEQLVSACVRKADPMTASQAKAAGLTVLTSADAPGRSVVDICRALIDGKLASAATVQEAHGLMRLRLRMSDVNRVLPARTETLSLRGAALQMGTHQGHLALWARNGFFTRAESSYRGETGLRVEQAELDRFRAKYITGGELATLCGRPGNSQISRHVRHVGVKPVFEPGANDNGLLLFRRSDCTPQVFDKVRCLLARPPGTQTEKHRRAFARTKLVADIVAARWGVEFKRINNRFVDPVTGRTLQVVAGRRASVTRTFRFELCCEARERLGRLVDAWVAFIPSEEDTFILVPFKEIIWPTENLKLRCISVHFDGSGRLLEMKEWAVPLPVAGTSQ